MLHAANYVFVVARDLLDSYAAPHFRSQIWGVIFL